MRMGVLENLESDWKCLSFCRVFYVFYKWLKWYWVKYMCVFCVNGCKGGFFCFLFVGIVGIVWIDKYDDFGCLFRIIFIFCFKVKWLGVFFFLRV